MSPVRRVRRVVRRIDPWTVLKVSFVFNAIMALAFVLGSVIFWSIFVNAGIPERITDFAESLTLSFEVDGPLYFRVVLLLALIWAILMTGLATLGAVLYNLIADTVGGVEVVVLEEVITPVATPAGNVGVRPPRRRPARPVPMPAKTQKEPRQVRAEPVESEPMPTAPPADEDDAAPAPGRERQVDVPTQETPVAR